MEEISRIAQGGWAAAVAIVAAIAYFLVRLRASRADERAAKRAELEAQLRQARAEWSAATFCGDPARVHASKRRIDSIEEQIAALCVALLLAVCAAGCASPKTRTLVLSDHCRTAAPGDTVPDLPAGEPRWWLCTPTGLRMLLPADADIPEGASHAH